MDTTQNITCELCGGTDFYNEDGFYYCNECQTQTQELRVQHFEATAKRHHDISLLQTQRSKKRKKKTTQKITSWECYNYILLGLVNELMELGADGRLKQLVKSLWMKYLKQIGVMRKDSSVPPKLQGVNFQRDAAVLYGRKFRYATSSRASSRSSSSSQSSGTKSLTSRGEKMRKRRAMVASEYNKMSSQQSESSTNMHTSLHSLRSSSIGSSRRKKIVYTPSALSDMRKMMSKAHLREHLHDIDNDLLCHPMTYKQFSTRYKKSSEIVTLRKLYSIIYVALLLLKDKIQLGDMIRFIYEGRLSYNNLWHFFPEEIEKKTISSCLVMRSWPVFKHKFMRETTVKMIKFLKMDYYMPTQNLLELCRRYCLEMNLPVDLEEYCVNLIIHVDPKFNQVANYPLPNYEGRVACLIIVALKLFFGIDNITEKKFSHLAEEVRDRSNDVSPFHFNEWIEFIYYRDLIVRQHHFSSQFFASKGNEYPDTFPDFIEEQQRVIDLEDVADDEYDILKRLLTSLRDGGVGGEEKLEFPVTLTPYTEYMGVLIRSGLIFQKGYREDILNRNFRMTNLDYLKRPKRFVDGDIVEEARGANLDVEFLELWKFERTNRQNDTTKVMVKVLKKKEIVDLTQLSAEEDFKAQRIQQETYIKQPIDEGVYERHYQPEQTYWLNGSYRYDKVKWLGCMRWFKSMPVAFQVIVKELARITNQSVKEIMLELQVVETHLCYADGVSSKHGKMLTKYNERFW